jgi:uncharacterized surface protein with fasciclin (FAS1) repeats
MMLCALVIFLFAVSTILQGCGGDTSTTTTTTTSPAGADTIPGLASKTASLSTLVAALKAADLVDTLSGKGPFTVFAPNNDAFDAIPKATLTYLLANQTALTQVLTYHVVSGKVLSTDLKNGEKVKTLEGDNVTVKLDGSGVMVNDAKVIKADVMASNGVVHIIDKVLLPPGFVPPTIPDLAIATPDLSTLVTALKAADLVTTLSGEGPFTVFAPTNEAFSSLPAGVLDALLKPANLADLKKVLTYHVAAGEVESSALKNGQAIKTLEGQDVNVTISGSNVKINEAAVKTADVLAANGVIHIISGVLLPPGFVPPASKTIVDEKKEIQI